MISTQRIRSFFESVPGWREVALAFSANVAVVGIGFYSFSVFFKPLAEHFGWSRALVAWGPGVSLIVSAFFAPLAGRLVDKYGMRPMLMWGSMAAALSLVLMGFMQSIWQYFFLFGVIFSIANVHMGDIVTGSTVARRFPGRPGVALGIAAVGVSFGGVIVPPFSQWIISEWGWRAGFMGLAAVAMLLVFLPAVFLLRKNHHEVNNEEPAPNKIKIESESERSWTRSEALASTRFWKLVTVFGLGFFPLGTMLVPQVPFLTDPGIGLSTSRATLVLSFTAAMGMAGKVIWGTLFDKIEGRWAVAASFTMQAAAIVWLLNASTFADALIFGFFFGLGMGGMVPMHTAMRARQFGHGYLGAIMGISSPVTMLAQAGGQPLGGWIFDITGTYHAAFYSFIACYLLGVLIIITLRDPKDEEVVDQPEQTDSNQ